MFNLKCSRISFNVLVLVISVLNLTISIELKCDYRELLKSTKCFALEWNILSENENVTEFKGRQSNLKNREVTSLGISYQNVKFLPHGVFILFPKLNVVDIFHSSLQSLQATNFDNAKELKDLRIARNNMTVLQHYVFAEIKNLIFLELTQNKISIISENAFSGLTHLYELSLKKNNVNNLPDNVFKELTSLVMLDLSHNEIKEVNSKLFAFNRDLEKLDLDFNQIGDLHGDLFKSNTKLSSVLLAHNHIKTIGSQLLTFSDTIGKLNFHGNDCINACFGISHCKLTTIDMFIEELRNKCSKTTSHELTDLFDEDEEYDEYDDHLMFDDWDTTLFSEKENILKNKEDEEVKIDSPQSIVNVVDRWNNSWIIGVLSVLAVSILVSLVYRKYNEYKIRSRDENIVMSESLITEDS